MLQAEGDPSVSDKTVIETVKQGVISGIYQYRGFSEFQVDGIDTAMLAKESLRWRTRMSARRVADWHHVKRATFFPHSDRQGIAQNALSANRFVPRLTKVAKLVQKGIRYAGEELEIEPLASYSINRIGINYMLGKHNRMSEIPPHRDVETEHGAVVVLRLSEGPSTKIVNNNTQIIFSRDVCDAYGIPQHEHSASTNQRRLSATLADLRR